MLHQFASKLNPNLVWRFLFLFHSCFPQPLLCCCCLTQTRYEEMSPVAFAHFILSGHWATLAVYMQHPLNLKPSYIWVSSIENLTCKCSNQQETSLLLPTAHTARAIMTTEWFHWTSELYQPICSCSSSRWPNPQCHPSLHHYNIFNTSRTPNTSSISFMSIDIVNNTMTSNAPNSSTHIAPKWH